MVMMLGGSKKGNKLESGLMLLKFGVRKGLQNTRHSEQSKLI